MHKYERLRQDLEQQGKGRMVAIGNSMMPLIKSHSLLTFEPRDEYEIGDIVFCKVKGNTYIHKILKKDRGRYQIGNNKGRINGWTKTVWGKVVKIEGPNV